MGWDVILGTKARYAVMAMVELASRTEGVPIALSQLADAQEITLPYLEQIFSKLRKQGLVQSSRGPGGGYVLAKAASEIDVAKIVFAVDESIKMTRCDSHDAGGCLSKKSRCYTHHLWEGLENHIEGYLQSVTLADITARKLPATFIPVSPQAAG